MSTCDFTRATLVRADVHAWRDAGAVYHLANLAGIMKTDDALLAAGAFTPPDR